MRFDDKLETAFAQPAEDQAALAAAWMQIVDILAQDRSARDDPQRAEALNRLITWRDRIPVDRRRASARSLSGRTVPADLVALFGCDVPQVASAILPSVIMDDDGWKAILPGLTPTARALLRERRDLSTATRQMLANFGSSDFALPGSDAVRDEQSDAVAIQIRDLVARIEAFRKDKALEPSQAITVEHEPAPVSFRFETGTDGTINWVEGAPRGAIIGIEVATMADIGSHGVDGHAAGAFRRRTPFRNARLLVPGNGPAAGEWLISGLPCFNERDGRFFGYRCTARRAERDERPITDQISLFGSALPADSVRQLVHELRTPLNAIRGFAEMIQGQLLGPVSTEYRQRATNIIGEASRLLSLFEDLDAAAKLERGTIERRAGAQTDVSEVLKSIADEFVSLTNRRQVHLRLATSPKLPPVAIDPVSVERMLTRLMSAVIGLCRTGETISANVTENARAIVFSIDRPLSIAGQSERDLFDPAYGPEGDWPDAPALGLGFALRLVASLARAAKGRLTITEDKFALSLPTRDDEAGSTQTQG